MTNDVCQNLEPIVYLHNYGDMTIHINYPLLTYLSFYYWIINVLYKF